MPVGRPRESVDVRLRRPGVLVIVASLVVLAASVAVAAAWTRADDASRRAPSPVVTPTTTPLDDGAHSTTDEVRPPGSASPTAAQRRQAEQLEVRVDASIERHGWRSMRRARRDGYRPLPGAPDHWYDPEALADGVQFDADAPEFLMFHAGELAGFMFMQPTLDLDAGPPPGSPLVRWHYHRWDLTLCVAHGVVPSQRVRSDRPCPSGEVPTDHSPLMVHVWTMDGTDPFATEMDGAGHGEH